MLPHLRRGMRLLDAGCGPGSITLGLAEAIAPAEAIGIDVSAESIAAAWTMAHGRGITNLRFDVADVYALPFEDGLFDAAVCHAGTAASRRTAGGAARDPARVLRPGGVIGVADADHDGMLLSPRDPLLDRSLVLLGSLRARGSSGDSRVGKRLRELLHDAGFV